MQDLLKKENFLTARCYSLLERILEKDEFGV